MIELMYLFLYQHSFRPPHFLHSFLFFVESKALTVMEARKEEKKLKVLCSGLGGGKLTKAVS